MTHKKPRIKILFILPSLRAGGAERVMSFVAQNLDKSKFDCSLIILGSAKDAVYTIEGIDVQFLNKPRVIKSINPLFKVISERKPDIVVGSIAHVNRVLTMLRVYFRKTTFVGREASLNGIITKFTSNNKKFKYWKYYKNYFKNLDMIICQSIEMADNLKTNYAVPDNKIAIINNPISSLLPLRKKAINKEETKQFITIGRLSIEKGHERIMRVLSKIDFPFQYTIIGKGDIEDELTNLAKELNILDKIKYIPYTNNVAQYLSESDLFLQGSYVEGFPNALLESCAVGTPVIAFNAPGGTKEIIDNDNGFLADNEDQYLEYIHKSLSKDWEPKTIRDSVIKKFNKNKILSLYETSFMNLIEARKK